MAIVEAITTDEGVGETYQLMTQLHERVRRLDRSSYVKCVNQLRAEDGYHLVARREQGKVVCVAGYRICGNLGWGKYLYVDDLVTDAESRSKGLGKKMLAWLIRRARKEQCAEIRLDAKLERREAHRFYLRDGMEIVAYHFKMELRQKGRGDSVQQRAAGIPAALYSSR